MKKDDLLIQNYIQKILDWGNENPHDFEAIKEYLNATNNSKNEVRNHEWMVGYTSKFDTIGISVRKDIAKEFDWELLIKLAASSMSSILRLKIRFLRDADLIIIVNSDERILKKKLIELTPSQIDYLYIVYIVEQINLRLIEIKCTDDEREKINFVKAKKISYWNTYVKRKKLLQQLFRIISFRS